MAAIHVACLVVFFGAASASRDGRVSSFLVLGDWGWDQVAHGNVRSRDCQQLIANKMDEAFEELGDVKFIINVGDSFYPTGVFDENDEQWDSKWREVYSARVRGVPWYSVYGNHDMLADNGTCSDEEFAAQINYDVKDLDHFFMPGYSWFLEHEELDLEVLALDLNNLWVDQTCPHTACEVECRKKVAERADAAFNLFYERMEASNASNLIVFLIIPLITFGHTPMYLATSPKLQGQEAWRGMLSILVVTVTTWIKLQPRPFCPITIGLSEVVVAGHVMERSKAFWSARSLTMAGLRLVLSQSTIVRAAGVGGGGGECLSLDVCVLNP